MNTLPSVILKFSCSLFCILLLRSPKNDFNQINLDQHLEISHKESYENHYSETANERTIVNRFSELLRIPESDIKKNIRLYSFINDWFGIRYLWGGCTRSGIDCSCFVKKLYKEVFNMNINRTSLEQFTKDVVLYRNKDMNLQMGDLVFFKTPVRKETRFNKVTHVGFYLSNGYFVQSSSRGVNIASLNSRYWRNFFVGAGRLKDVFYNNNSMLAKPRGEVDYNKLIEVEDSIDGSQFDPIFYPEDRDSITYEYSEMIGVDKNYINFYTEIFQFIEKNRYAPYSITSRCENKSAENNCFISTFFNDVYHIGLKNMTNAEFQKKYVNEKTLSATPDTMMDIIQLIPPEKTGYAPVTGIYLFNGYILYLDKNDLSVSNVNDPAFAHWEKKSYWYKKNNGFLDKIRDNMLELRKNGGVWPDKEAASIDGQIPINVLKSGSIQEKKEAGAAPAQGAEKPQKKGIKKVLNDINIFKKSPKKESKQPTAASVTEKN